MERLTDKKLFGNEYQYWVKEIKGTQNAINLLGQLEDLMEKYHIPTIEELYKIIDSGVTNKNNWYTKRLNEKYELEELNQELKNNEQKALVKMEEYYSKCLILEDQLKNAIVPKFKINQTVYFFNDCNVIACGQIGDIKTHKSYCGDGECENFVSYTIYIDNNSYATDYERQEEYVFSTQEEAEKKLEEFDKDKEEYITNLMKEFAVENNPICARVGKVEDECRVDITDKLMLKDHEIEVLKKALELAIYNLTHSADYVACEHCIYNVKDCSGNCPNAMERESEYYIDQARKELESKYD